MKPNSISEILFTVGEAGRILFTRSVFVAIDMKGMTQTFGTTEKDTDIRRTVFVTNTGEDAIPIGSTVMGGSSKSSDSITIVTNVVGRDVFDIIQSDFGSEVSVNFNKIFQILFFDSKQEGLKPFERLEFATDPNEINLL